MNKASEDLTIHPIRNFPSFSNHVEVHNRLASRCVVPKKKLAIKSDARKTPVVFSSCRTNPSEKKNACQIRSFPQVEVKIWNHLLDSPSFDHYFCGHLRTIWILRDTCQTLFYNSPQSPLLATGGHGSKEKTHGNPWWFMIQNGGEHPKIGDRSMVTILSDHWDKIGWNINTNIITMPIGKLDI